MKCIGECTCEHSIQVQNCGNGKYNVIPSSNRKITLYARVSMLRHWIATVMYIVLHCVWVWVCLFSY